MITSMEAVDTLIRVCGGEYTQRTHSTTARDWEPAYPAVPQQFRLDARLSPRPITYCSDETPLYRLCHT